MIPQNNSGLYLIGMIASIIRNYTLNNYSFDFVALTSSDMRSLQLLKKIQPVKSLRTLYKNSKIIIPNLSTFVSITINLKVKYAVMHYLTTKYYYQLSEKKRESFLINRIWGNLPGSKWHQALETVYSQQKKFIHARMPLIRMIKWLKPQAFNGIIEVGSGNGWFLNELSKKIDRKISFVGIDVNQHTVARAKNKFKQNKKLTFVTSDLNTYSKTHSLKGKLIVFCFVLEYFSTAELKKLYKLLKNHSASYCALIERVANKKFLREAPIGGFSYSHDYLKIFTDAGLSIEAKNQAASNDDHFYNLTALLKI